MYSIELQTVFYEYQNKNHKINTSFNLKIFHFDIRGKLSIIRCDKYIILLVASLVLKKSSEGECLITKIRDNAENDKIH